jgi:hypothetical protein
MTQPNQRKEASRRAHGDREPAIGREDRIDAKRLDPAFLPPHADQFRITDLQLWIDLSA